MLSKFEAIEDQEAYREWKALDAYITDGPCREWELHYKDSDERVAKGVTALDFRGDTDVLIGGRAPRHSGSTGKVWTREGNEYYPGVFNMRWVKVRTIV